MTVRLWLQNALATVSKSLTGRKRKAVDERQEEEDGALPSQLPPPSSERPQPQQAVGSAGRRVPERLDFSSPAMNGQKWGGTKGLRGAAAPGTTHPQQAGASTPGPTRRLDGSLAADLAGTAVGLRSRQHDMLPATGVPLPPQIAATAPRGRPLAKRFKQPRMTAQRSDVSFPVLSNGVRHVREAGPSHSKLRLTPAIQQLPPQLALGQVQGTFTSGQNAGALQQLQHNQQDKLRHPANLAWHQQQGTDDIGSLLPSAVKPDDLQDATLLRWAVDAKLRQEEFRQQQHEQPARVEEMDLTLPSFAHHAPRQQQQQGQQWAQVATAPAMAVGASTRRWREILLQVVAQDDDLSQLRKDQPAAPAGLAADGEDRYRELVAAAQLATRRALQAQERELYFVQQAHTALEHGQPQRVQLLEAEAQKIEMQLQLLQLQRQQQAQPAAQHQHQPDYLGQQQRQEMQETAALLAAAEEEVVTLLSSSEEATAEASVSIVPGATESDQGGSEVSHQLERVGLAEEPEPPPIPDEWGAEYEAALAPGPPSEVLVDHARSSIQVTRKDMACMAPMQWLNDEVINLYISLLLERDAAWRKQGTGPRCHFFSTFFANKLYKDIGYNYDQVRRWTLPKRLAAAGQTSESILDCDRIVVPVHQGVHWVCAVIDLQNQKLVYYDSLKGEDHKCLQQLALYLRDEFRNKRNLQRDDVLDWPREFPKRIPQQFNGCDCGVFTLLFANYVGRAAPLDFTQAHIDNFRVRIVHELLHLCVE